MASQLVYFGVTGSNIYATILNDSASWWNNVSLAFETYAATGFTNYAVSLTEAGSSGVYSVAFPAIPTFGEYNVSYWKRAGGSAAITDLKTAIENFPWSGSARVLRAATNASGSVTVGTYASGQDPATLLGSNFSTVNTNINNVSGNVWLNTTRSLTDKSNFSLTQPFPSNFSSLAIDSLGRVTPSGSVTVAGTVTVGTNNDKTGYTVSTVSDKTGYSLSQGFPNNFSSMTIDSSGRVTVSNSVAVSGTVTIGGYSAGQDPLSLLTTDSIKWAGGNIDAKVSGVSGNVWSYSNRSLTDKSNFILASSEHTNIQTDVASGITGQGYTSARATNLDNLDVLVSSRSAASGLTTAQTAITAIKAKTDNLPSDPASTTNVNNAVSSINSNTDSDFSSLTSELNAVKAQTDKLQFDGSNYILSDPQTQVTITTASLLAMANTILAASITNPTAAPTAPYTVDDILGFLLAVIKFGRTQTSSLETIFQDDGVTPLATATVSDNGTTFVKSEFS